MEGGSEDFGFVQRPTSVLEMAEKGGKDEAEGDEEGEESWEEGSQGSSSLERKSGELSSPPEVHPTTTAATGDTGARENRSDSGKGAETSSGDSKGKAAGRLFRTMSSYISKEKPSSQAVDPSLNELPQTFVVKYLGKRDARGLWGIKNTRRPVDVMVADAKGSKDRPPAVLPLIKLTVSRKGVTLTSATPSGATGDKKKKVQEGVFHPIDTISYGVQDLVYTRVFSMIIVRETTQILSAGQNMQHPFQCHGFVCDSRNSARRLTYVLAAAFQEFSKQLKMEEAADTKSEGGQPKKSRAFRKFAIDLRTPEQIEEDLKQPDSEA